MATEFKHLHAAHCETGVTAALLAHRGYEISEPMVFGIGGGLFFWFTPFIKVMEMPIISFRSYPGSVFKLFCRRMGVPHWKRRFLARARGVAELDALLDRGVPVGAQTNMFWLRYFPREFRFQFNAHNLVVTGRNGNGYRISDPVLEAPVVLDRERMARARFSRGPLSPRGLLYYPLDIPRNPDFRRAITKSIRQTCYRMVVARNPVMGVRGIRLLARYIRKTARRHGEGSEKLKLLLGHVVRMQEEVGTGGGGFRFMYAAFLQEASRQLEHEPFLDAASRMTEVGDRWREFAVLCGRVIKNRSQDSKPIDGTVEALEACASGESEIYEYLRAHLPEKR